MEDEGGRDAGARSVQSTTLQGPLLSRHKWGQDYGQVLRGGPRPQRLRPSLALPLAVQGIRGVRVGDPASYIANWLANNMPISWIDQVKMFTAQTSEWQELRCVEGYCLLPGGYSLVLLQLSHVAVE